MLFQIFKLDSAVPDFPQLDEFIQHAHLEIDEFVLGDQIVDTLLLGPLMQLHEREDVFVEFFFDQFSNFLVHGRPLAVAPWIIDGVEVIIVQIESLNDGGDTGAILGIFGESQQLRSRIFHLDALVGVPRLLALGRHLDRVGRNRLRFSNLGRELDADLGFGNRAEHFEEVCLQATGDCRGSVGGVGLGPDFEFEHGAHFVSGDEVVTVDLVELLPVLAKLGLGKFGEWLRPRPSPVPIRDLPLRHEFHLAILDVTRLLHRNVGFHAGAPVTHLDLTVKGQFLRLVRGSFNDRCFDHILFGCPVDYYFVSDSERITHPVAHLLVAGVAVEAGAEGPGGVVGNLKLTCLSR